MTFGNRRHRHYRLRRPAAAGLIAVVLAIGVVTKFFGLEAGFLAVVVAIFALAVAPHVYLPSASPFPSPRGRDESVGFLPPAARDHETGGPSFHLEFPTAEDPDPDADRSTR